MKEAVGPLCLTLHKYAGWLERGRAAAAVRTNVASLGTAIESGAETARLLSALDTSIAQLPGGAVRKMLQIAAGDIRRALETK